MKKIYQTLQNAKSKLNEINSSLSKNNQELNHKNLELKLAYNELHEACLELYAIKKYIEEEETYTTIYSIKILSHILTFILFILPLGLNGIFTIAIIALLNFLIHIGYTVIENSIKEKFSNYRASKNNITMLKEKVIENIQKHIDILISKIKVLESQNESLENQRSEYEDEINNLTEQLITALGPYLDEQIALEINSGPEIDLNILRTLDLNGTNNT